MGLELKKRLLQKVSFNKHQFSIELEHAVKKLNRIDRHNLIKWVKDEFGAKHPNVIDRICSKESRRIRLGI